MIRTVDLPKLDIKVRKREKKSTRELYTLPNATWILQDKKPFELTDIEYELVND